ncbi:hypothetical protein [Pedobacter ginsengisoli]|uniref:hypothetical protein n=1 Tax=Pedobacter ginsengisoli TaxID=363852 RepID=UPI00254C5B04|nr:hypothetical protein [Pedobacter ginsengisoli]
MSARILLPVKAHIKKYLTVQFGPEMAISDIGTIPMLLFLMLEKHKKADPGVVKPNQRLIDDKKYFGYKVYIGDKYQESRGLYLSREKIIRFNESIDNMMREDMFRFCQSPGENNDHVVDYNINRFREFYGIWEDELPFDNLKRWYYRERIRLEEHLRVEKRYEPQMELIF